MNKRHFIITVSFILVSIIVSLFVLQTPIPNMENEESSETRELKSRAMSVEYLVSRLEK